MPALRDGYLAQVDVRGMGLAVVALGGGRSRPEERLDLRVGLAAVAPRCAVLRVGEPLCWVHAADDATAERAAAAVQAACEIKDEAPEMPALVCEVVDG